MLSVLTTIQFFKNHLLEILIVSEAMQSRRDSPDLVTSRCGHTRTSWQESLSGNEWSLARDFLGAPVAETRFSQGRGPRFDPSSGNQTPHAATKSLQTKTEEPACCSKTQHSQINHSDFGAQERPTHIVMLGLLITYVNKYLLNKEK